MEKKTILKILIILFFVLLVLIVIEKTMRGTNRVLVGIGQKYTEWKQEKDYLKSEEYQEEKKIEGILDEVEALLQTSDLDVLYSLTNPLYLEYKFENDRNLFDEYMKRFVGENITIEFQSYEKRADMYACSVISSQEEESKVWYLLIIPKNEEETEYSLIFENLNGISRVNLEATNDDLHLKSKIKFVATAPKSLIFVIENENVGTTDINYEYSNATLLDTSNHSFSLNSLKGNKISIKPGEKTRETFRFMDNSIFYYPKKRMSISFTDTAGKDLGGLFFQLQSLGL